MDFRGNMKLFSVLLPILASCGVGTYGESSGDNAGDDMPMVEDRNMCANRGTVGTAYAHSGADGQPAGARAGMGCVAAGCHLAGNTGTNAPAYAFAGTVYKETAGTTANGGVVVRIFPSTGNTKKSVATAVTDDAGNFYISDVTLTAYPYNTDATACGSDAVAQGIRPMVGSILKAEANCNAGNTCHQVVPTKTATPIYLMD